MARTEMTLEISAGLFDGMQQFSPGGILYLVGPLAWSFGFPLAPMLAPFSADPNGVFFFREFSGAMQTIYDHALANPVVAALVLLTLLVRVWARPLVSLPLTWALTSLVAVLVDPHLVAVRVDGGVVKSAF